MFLRLLLLLALSTAAFAADTRLVRETGALTPAQERAALLAWFADPALWTEHYHCPTWGDYLRMRGRYTETDMTLQAEADAFHTAIDRPRIRRKLERPFGPVRWRAESPDQHQKTVGFILP